MLMFLYICKDTNIKIQVYNMISKTVSLMYLKYIKIIYSIKH